MNIHDKPIDVPIKIEKKIFAKVSSLTNTRIERHSGAYSFNLVKFVLPQNIFAAPHIYGFMVKENYTIVVNELKGIFVSDSLADIKKAVIGTLIDVYLTIDEYFKTNEFKSRISYGVPYSNRFSYIYSLFKKGISKESLTLSSVLSNLD